MNRPQAGRIRRGLRELRAWLASPEDAWMLARLLAWYALLPGLKRLLPLSRLVRMTWLRKPGGSVRSDREQRVVRLARWLYGRRGGADGRCLERSLLIYRFLSACGADPVLVVGLRKGGGGLVGHAWVCAGGQPVGEPAGSLAEFVPLISFGAGGEAWSIGSAHPSGNPCRGVGLPSG